MLPFAAWVYGKIVDLRNSMYDSGVLRSYSLGARTISIGNITTGGTGKTPLVAYVAEVLAKSGEKVCILTRGYGREYPRNRVLVSDGETLLVDARTGGDEPVELARKLIGKAIIISHSDRVSAAAWANERFTPTVFILDDAFQHRRAKRDIDIVCIDAMFSLRSDRLLPAGSLREPPDSLARADAIVITRANLTQNIEAMIAEVRAANTRAHIFQASARLAGLNSLQAFLKGAPISDEKLELTKQTMSFSGLGNPQPFLTMLANKGTTFAEVLDDHHRYTQMDVKEIEEKARWFGCDRLVTTAKDAVKLDRLAFELPCMVAEIEMVIDDPKAFRKLITSS